ncbi:N-acetylmuramoyl-L-alanine amidase [Streptomyces inhibens]|uniref:N-acetylmuramoyl-L-alanine amidase n=1 Tax=Streptomyces inhibens TaxID=2293571 RepID=A0A371Q7K7_STRIH|nr:peptidoglycan recognition protein [Streptomyces inhibens]REK90660.1 N-acetylmuramoyl-L-alanine amidase [Streptomyces inhibens]
MRPFLAICLGAACTAAFALPVAPDAGAGARRPAAPSAGDLPGSTQSLPVAALGAPAPHTTDRDTLTAPAAQSLGLPARSVRPFSLLGVVWDDADAQLQGRVQVRTRATGSGAWSGWQDVQAHNDDAPDLGAAERHDSDVRGSTAPLWVGDSDAVQLRITPEAHHRAPATLPGGLRLELVDPGEQPRTDRGRRDGPPAPLTLEAAAASAANAKLAPLGATEIPALDLAASQADVAAVDGPPLAQTSVGPRPRIVTRAGWGADEQLREKAFTYTHTVRAAFVHHSGSGNNYTCAQAPSLIRAMYRFHVKSNHWRDIGYNFLIDKCGTVYEGRAGGVAKPVMGAHTLGFNNDSTGIAVLGTFTDTEPPKRAVDAVARLTAWKLGLYGVDPRATIAVRSGGSNRFPKGTKVRLHVISGHRDGFTTDCPGVHLYNKLAATRLAAAGLQGR